MDKAVLTYGLIEAVIFLIPIITLFVKLGRYAEQIDFLRARVDSLQTLDNRLTTIETKIDLLLSDKIKMGNNEK